MTEKFSLNAAVEPQRHREHRGEDRRFLGNVVHPDGEPPSRAFIAAGGFLCVLWYVMQNSTNPVSWNVLTPRKGNQAGSSADVRAGAIPPMELGGCAEASRSDKRTRNGLVTQMRATKLPEMLKSAPAGKRYPDAPAGLSGVKGGSAPRRGGWEHESAIAAVRAFRPGEPDPGINNRVGCRGWQSERPVVAMKRVMTVERRGLGVSGADSEVRAA